MNRAAFFDSAIDHRTRGGRGNAQKKNHRKIVFHDGDIAEKVPYADDAHGPKNGTEAAEEFKASHAHFCSARHQRGKRTDDRHESRQHDCFAAVLFIKPLSFREFFGINPFY